MTSSQAKSAKISPIPAALIGMGHGAEKITLPGLTSLPQINLLAACDIDKDRRGSVAARWNIPRTYPDPQAMLEAEKPGLVVVATPPLTHYDMCTLALEHGCHVFCEKPFMPSLEQADIVIERFKKAGRHLDVNSQYYLMPIYRAALDGICSGQAGRLFSIDAWQHMQLLPNEEGGWKAALAPRRVLFEFGTHAIDLACRFFEGFPHSVSARIAKVRDDVDADVCIQVRLDFPGERIANLTFNRLSHAPTRYFEMRLNGDAASYRISLGGVARFDLGWNRPRRRPRLRFSLTGGGETRLEHNGSSQVVATQPGSAYGDASRERLAHFVSGIIEDRGSPGQVAHDREVLRVMLAAYESAENGGVLVTL